MRWNSAGGSFKTDIQHKFANAIKTAGNEKLENTLADEMLDADKNKSESEESSPEDFQERISVIFCAVSSIENEGERPHGQLLIGLGHQPIRASLLMMVK